MSKVIIFSRVSTAKQELAEQTAELCKKAEWLGYSKDSQIVIEYKESGISLNVDERAGIARLRESICSDPTVDCVLIWELSRIGRRADVIFNVRDFLIEHKCRWVVMKPEMEILGAGGQLTPTTNMMLGMWTTFVENEMVVKKERFKRGKEANRERGLYAGGPIIYGYKVVNKHYVVDERAAAIVKYVYNCITIKKISAHSIAKEFFQTGKLGIMTMMQCRSKVKHILSKREYCGTKAYPAIISEQQYEEAQRLLTERRCCKTRTTLHTYFCQGIIFDAKTGHALTPQWNDAIYTNDYKPVDSKPSSSIAINTIDSIAFALAQRHMARYGNVSKNEAMKEMKRQMVVTNRKLNVANRRKAELQEQIDKIEMRYLKGKLTEEMANRLEDQAENEMREQARLVKVYSGQLQDCIDTINKYKDDIAKVSMTEIMDDDAKKEIVQSAIKKITVDSISKFIRNISVTYDNMTTETYQINSRTRALTDESGNKVDYVYEKRICRQNKVRKPNKNVL